MPDRSRQVLRVNATEEEALYLSAVSTIIGNILRVEECNLIDIADTIDVDTKTISNAFNKKGRLNALYLGRLGKAYGPHTLDPYLALMGGRSVPLNAEEVDPLPSLLRVATRQAEIRAPDSQGGITETPSELSGILPLYESAQADISAKVVSIKRKLAS